MHTLTLDPGNYTFVGCGSGSALNFAVGQDGFINYDPSLEGVMKGAGTGGLVVNGFTITIDSKELSQPDYRLGGVTACVDGTLVHTWNLLE